MTITPDERAEIQRARAEHKRKAHEKLRERMRRRRLRADAARDRLVAQLRVWEKSAELKRRTDAYVKAIGAPDESKLPPYLRDD